MEQKTLALFGGSFDPVTNAHKDIIDRLSSRFDKVVVMPVNVSPFKTGVVLADGKHRAEMLKRCTRKAENVKVSGYELKKADVSYTVDTVKHLKEKFPEYDVYTVIGSEELPFLHKWHNPQELKALTTFYVVERPRFPLTAALVEAAVAEGFRVRTAPFTGMDVSSSEIKLKRAFGEDDLPVPKTVAKYIEKNNLYGDYRVITERYDEFGLKPSRVEHIKRTAYAAISLAKRFGVCAADALTAALLHDVAKETDAKWMADHDLAVPADAAEMPLAIRHAVYGAVIAEKCFGIENAEILEAIRLHTTAGTKMSELAEVIFLADCIEEGRDSAGAEKTRLAVREGLKKGMEAALKYTIDYLKDAQLPIYPAALKAYARYKKLNKEGSTTQIGETKTLLSEEKSAPKTTAKKSKKVASVTEVPAEKETKPIAEKAAKKTEKKPDAQAAESEAEKAEAPAAGTGIAKSNKKQRVSAADAASPKAKAHDLAYTIGQFLDEKKALDITLIDISERTIIADYFVIAGATSTTQVKALAEYVDEKLSKNYGIEPLHRDVDAKWYVVDYGSVIVHIFYDEFRKFYQLERLWADGTNTEIIGGEQG